MTSRKGQSGRYHYSRSFDNGWLGVGPFDHHRKERALEEVPVCYTVWSSRGICAADDDGYCRKGGADWNRRISNSADQGLVDLVVPCWLHAMLPISSSKSLSRLFRRCKCVENLKGASSAMASRNWASGAQ